MIAPLNFTDELELYLYVSDGFQKQFKLNPANLPQDTELELPADWWSIWRAEQIHFEDDMSWVLFTNAKTLFSFCYRAYRDDYESVIQDFEHGLLSSMKANGLQLPAQVSTHLVPMTGQPDALIDSMSMFAEHFLTDISEREATREDAEIRLWSIPCATMDYELPSEAYLRELRAFPPFGAKVIPSTDEDPFVGMSLSRCYIPIS